MSKSAITRLFVGAILAVVAGVIIALVAVVQAIASGVVTIGGAAIVTVNGGPFAGTLIWLVVASAAMAVGTLAALVAWIGALLNTVQLEDRTWFVVLLVLGLFSFGWIAMLAYVLFGPDSTSPRLAREIASTARG
jgi:hypothetical protein